MLITIDYHLQSQHFEHDFLAWSCKSCMTYGMTWSDALVMRIMRMTYGMTSSDALVMFMTYGMTSPVQQVMPKKKIENDMGKCFRSHVKPCW